MADCKCLWFPPGHRLVERYGLGAAALRYAWLGFAVIPLVRGGKRPHRMLGERGGVHLASREPEQIHEWWSLDMVANIGVATGIRNRLAVVDLDVKRGNNGPDQFWGFLANNSVQPGATGLPWPRWQDVPTVHTPSGGAHLWLRMDGEVPERPGILPGVDIKGDGGLVVAPPSMQIVHPVSRPGERGTGEIPVPYDWLTGCPHSVPDVPLWFGGWLAFATPAPRTDRERTTTTGAPLDQVLETYMRSGIPEGMRNREMYRVACGLYRRHGTGYDSASEVMSAIRCIYDNTDKTDFGWDEVLICAESARRFVERSREREDKRNAEFLSWLERRHSI